MIDSKEISPLGSPKSDNYITLDPKIDLLDPLDPLSTTPNPTKPEDKFYQKVNSVCGSTSNSIGITPSFDLESE
jgi:hypothetical protein